MSNYLRLRSESEDIRGGRREEPYVGSCLEEVADCLPSLRAQLHAEIVDVKRDVLLDHLWFHFLGVGAYVLPEP